jgi:hypothetical protein
MFNSITPTTIPDIKKYDPNSMIYKFLVLSSLHVVHFFSILKLFNNYIYE